MKTIPALTILMVIATLTSASAQETQDTYLGDITFQNQTISQKSAKKLHRQMQLARASELVIWSMPIANFYQALKATLYMCCINVIKFMDDVSGVGSVFLYVSR